MRTGLLSGTSTVRVQPLPKRSAATLEKSAIGISVAGRALRKVLDDAERKRGKEALKHLAPVHRERR